MSYGNTVVDDICKKERFIYEIDSVYYVIGFGCFVKYYAGSGIRYYIEYKKCLEKIGRDNIKPYELDENSAIVKDLLENFNKVLSKARIFASAPQVNDKILKFVYGLDENDRCTLLEQLKDFVNVYQCYSRVY